MKNNIKRRIKRRHNYQARKMLFVIDNIYNIIRCYRNG